jgi:hypothetical protein
MVDSLQALGARDVGPAGGEEAADEEEVEEVLHAPGKSIARAARKAS